MAVALNGASASNSINSTTAGGVAITFSFTCPALTDCLVLVESMSTLAGAVGLPTAVTYNGVSFTNVVGSLASEGVTTSQVSVWYLLAAGLTTGSSLVCSITYPAGVGSMGEQVTFLQGLIGTNQVGPVGTPSIANGNSTAAAVVPSGAGANDLYIGAQYNQNATSTSGGNQTLIRNTVARGTTDQSVDQAIAGAGAFQWTITSGIWVATAVPFLSSAGPNAAKIAWVS